jgi:hypothetical protein
MAFQILQTWYFDYSVDLNNNAKDHVRDLEVMLSDIIDLYGEEELNSFLNHPSIDRAKLSDKRVMEAIEIAKS